MRIKKRLNQKVERQIWRPLVALMSLLVVGLASCQPASPVVVTRQVEVTRPVLFEREVEVEVTREVIIIERPQQPEIPAAATLPAATPFPQQNVGSSERPIRVVFLPDHPAPLVEVRGGFLLDYLEQETGYEFVAITPATAAAAVAELCDRPQETIAVLSPQSYLMAAAECDVQVTHAATRFDVPYQLGMLVARQDRPINVAEDVAFKTVGVPSFDDLSTYLWFATHLAERRIGPVEYVELGTSSAALLAVLDGEVDVAAAVFNPPIMPRQERSWDVAVDPPEIWRQLEQAPERDPIGYIEVAGGPDFGGYRIRDTRAALFDDFPEIFADTRIILLSAPVPNEAVVVGRDFPFAAVQTILPALQAFAESELCDQSVCASDFYRWDGLEPVTDDFYDVWRAADSSGTQEQNTELENR